MKLGSVIREHRKRRNMTQEQLAQRLGVSTPAVNKWENDNSYPDITLLSPLARALDIDLDTLFSFREQMSAEEIAHWSERLREIAEQEGMQAAHEAAVERVRQYPNCGLLLLQSASMLKGLNLIYGTQPDPYREECTVWLERAAQDSDPHAAELAVSMLIGQYRAAEQYDKAQELLNSQPEQHMDKRHQQASIYLDSGELQKAYEVMEAHLLSTVTELLMVVTNLLMAAQKEQDEQAQRRYLALYEQLSRTLHPVGGWMYQNIRLALALERKDRQDSLRCMRELLDAPAPFDKETAYLYRHSKIKDTSELQERRLMLRMLKAAPETEFLRDDPEFLALIARTE